MAIYLPGKVIEVPFSKKKNAVGIHKALEEWNKEEGMRKGKRQERRRMIKRMLENKRLSVKEIAAIAEVPVAFVQSVRGRKKRTV